MGVRRAVVAPEVWRSGWVRAGSALLRLVSGMTMVRSQRDTRLSQAPPWLLASPALLSRLWPPLYLLRSLLRQPCARVSPPVTRFSAAPARLSGGGAWESGPATRESRPGMCRSAADKRDRGPPKPAAEMGAPVYAINQRESRVKAGA